MTSPSSQADPRSLADDGLSPYTAAILREASRGFEGGGEPSGEIQPMQTGPRAAKGQKIQLLGADWNFPYKYWINYGLW